MVLPEERYAAPRDASVMSRQGLRARPRPTADGAGADGTFDDGFRSYLEHVHPILQAYGFGAVPFRVVAFRPGLQCAVVWSEYLGFLEILEGALP